VQNKLAENDSSVINSDE